MVRAPARALSRTRAAAITALLRPLFLPVDTPGKTMAELTADEKNAISHRFHALEHLSAKLTGEE